MIRWTIEMAKPEVPREKKIEGKWTDLKGPLRHYQMGQYTHCGSLRKRKRKGREDYLKK